MPLLRYLYILQFLCFNDVSNVDLKLKDWLPINIKGHFFFFFTFDQLGLDKL